MSDLNASDRMNSRYLEWRTRKYNIDRMPDPTATTKTVSQSTTQSTNCTIHMEEGEEHEGCWVGAGASCGCEEEAT